MKSRTKASAKRNSRDREKRQNSSKIATFLLINANLALITDDRIDLLSTFLWYDMVKIQILKENSRIFFENTCLALNKYLYCKVNCKLAVEYGN